jgi:hypothetical protein
MAEGRIAGPTNKNNRERFHPMNRSYSMSAFTGIMPRSMLYLVVAWLLAVTAGTTIPATAAEPAKTAVRIAVFDFELQDASHEGAIDGERPDQVARLRLVSDELRSLMQATDRFRVVDIGPARQAVAEKGPLIYCNGCDRDIARDIGADLALTGLVYKVSNLILEIHIHVRDVETGKIVAKMASSIRGNTDESWLHGVRWMFRNRLMKADLLAASQ